MYPYLLPTHSLFRWLLLIALVFSIIIAYNGWRRQTAYTLLANRVRHWTATIAHMQLLIGMVLYTQSPVVKIGNPFFRYTHMLLMLLSVVLITIGSAKAKRMSVSAEKYSTVLIWFIIALLIIFLAIPWPFSPFAARPYVRSF